MTRFVAVVSGKGGVGKTTTAINLGAALMNSGKDSIVLDGNLTAPNVGIYLGGANFDSTIHDVLDGKDVGRAVYLHASGLKFIPGNIKVDALKKLDLNKLRKAYNKLKGISEVVLIDTGAGLTKETLSVMNLADEVLVVTNPELAAVTDAMKTIEKAEESNKLVLGVVLNRYKEENEVTLQNVETMLGKPVLAVIPESDSVKKSHIMRHPVVHSEPKSDVALEFGKLAERLK